MHGTLEKVAGVFPEDRVYAGKTPANDIAIVAGAAQANAAATSRHRKVLIVDDDASIRMLFGMLLEGAEEADYSTDTAENGRAALGMLKKQRYDAMVLDAHMPEMSGVQLLNEMRKDGIDVATVMITGYISDVVKQVKESGARVYDILPKPISGDDLIDAVNNAVKAHEEDLAKQAPQK